MMVRVRVMRGARREKPTWEDGEMGRWRGGEVLGRCHGTGCEAREAELTCKGWSLD